MSCCDYECTRAPNCPAGSKDSMPYEFWPGHHVANELLSGETLPELVPLDEHWKTARTEMTKRQNDAYERAQAQWFKPLYNTPEPEPEILTPGRVLIGCGVFLLFCVGVAVAALNYWR